MACSRKRNETKPTRQWWQRLRPRHTSTFCEKMNCKCQKLGDVFYLDQAPRGFEKKLKEVDAKDWMRLYECPYCGQLWAIDEWDKYSWQVVSKVADKNGWANDQREKERKELLLSERGGTTQQECIWAGCSGKTVKGVVYCLEHLWQTGARR